VSADALREQASGDRAVDCDMRLTGGAGGGDFPAGQGQAGAFRQCRLDGIAFGYRLRSAVIGQSVEASFLLPGLPKGCCGGLGWVRVHGVFRYRPYSKFKRNVYEVTSRRQNLYRRSLPKPLKFHDIHLL
jgi:hypothetical protein